MVYSFYSWSLHCLSFFDLQLLSTSLGSSNFSSTNALQTWLLCFLTVWTILIFYFNALSYLKLLFINQICVQCFYFIRICRNACNIICSLYWDFIYITQFRKGPLWPWSYGGWNYNYLCNQCLSPMMLRVRFLDRARCKTLCDTVCQWLAAGRWVSPDPPVFSTNKTDRNDIAEILLKVALTSFNKQIFLSFQCSSWVCLSYTYIP
jgi:hypothetical protein